jgi:GMP synthase-like glutamine amidotransferase
MGSTVRICMLNAELPVPTVIAQRAPTYGLIFHELLARVSSDITIQSTDFDVMKMEYPTSLLDFDAIIVGGSANSAYDDVPWVHKLDNYVRDVYLHHPRIKIFGSCFGHQLVCQSLLKEYGVRVEVDPNGWEIGVKDVTLHKPFRDAFEKGSSGSSYKDSAHHVGKKMRLQFIHQDHVVIPSLEALPSSWITLGSTQHCAVQGIYQPGRVFTLQGHFEFDRFINSECVKMFFGEWTPEELQGALEAIDADDDSLVAAQMVLGFFGEKSAEENVTAHKVMDGLITPPGAE